MRGWKLYLELGSNRGRVTGKPEVGCIFGIRTDKRASVDRTDQLGNYCQRGRVVGRR